jgi:hypothetical protein
MTLATKKTAPSSPTAASFVAPSTRRAAIAIRSGVHAGVTSVGFPALAIGR